jgi:hypothetical protein
MPNLSAVVKQLRKERDRVEKQLSGLNAALMAFAGVYQGKGRRRRKMSAKSRAKIAAAQRARWAKVRAKNRVVPITRKRTMSASARLGRLQRLSGQDGQS